MKTDCTHNAKQIGTKRLSRVFSGNSLRAQLLRGSVGSLVLKAANAGLTFAMAVVLARALGPEHYGIYAFALAVLMLVAIPAQVGIPQLTVRETAKAHAKGNWGLMRGLWLWGNLAILATSVFGVLVVCGVLLFLGVEPGGQRAIAIAVGIPLIPLIALGNARAACLRGLHKIIWGQLPEAILRPLFILMLLGAWVALPGGKANASVEDVMGFNVAASAITFMLGAYMLWRVRPEGIKCRPKRSYEAIAWRRAIVPLAAITGLELINNYADLIVLGWFRSDSEVGIYRAVSQLALLVVFGLQAINQVLHPHFARLHTEGDIHKLQKLVTLSSRAILAMAFFPFLVFLFFGKEILTMVFGTEYAAGSIALIILAFGHLANAGFGSVGALLNMTGHERDTMKGMFVAMGANVVLNLLFVPFYGMNGASAATAISFILWNAVLRHYVRKRLSIESIALGKRKAATL